MQVRPRTQQASRGACEAASSNSNGQASVSSQNTAAATMVPLFYIECEHRISSVNTGVLSRHFVFSDARLGIVLRGAQRALSDFPGAWLAADAMCAE